MEEDIKILEEMRDNIYGAIQFEDDYEVRKLEQRQFDALNLAINHLRKTKLVHSQFIPKSKVQEKIEKLQYETYKIINRTFIPTISSKVFNDNREKYEPMLEARNILINALNELQELLED